MIENVSLGTASLWHQGESLQGESLQGESLQGESLQGESLQGVVIQGESLQGVTLNGTAFHGTLNGSNVSGYDFIGARIPAILSSGNPLTLTIDAIQPTDEEEEILEYTVLYNDDLGVPRSLCGNDGNGDPIKAIPLSGAWDQRQGVAEGGGDYIDDPTKFTFGCRNAVLAKCVMFGYWPWVTAEEYDSEENHQPISLRYYHQACTRLMRADFCGDGTPHTVTGTLINLFDNRDLQLDSNAHSWTLEAEWSSEGAMCVNHVRWTSTGATGAAAAQTYINTHCTDIDSVESLADCGTATSTYNIDVGYSTNRNYRSYIRTESDVP